MPVRTEPGPPGPAAAAAFGWRDRWTLLTGAALTALAAVAWVGVVRQAADMAAMGGMAAGADPSGTSESVGMDAMGGAGPADFFARGLGFVGAWGVMMAAMMLPSATPMIALYGTVSRNQARAGAPAVPVALFAATYLAVWLLVGVPVYAASELVARLADTSPAVAGLLPYGVALVLLAAGAYQLTPLKRVCLRVCQSPLAFLLARWRGGSAATLRLGLAHALYCVGCCWGLMAVLVAAGAMGLHWVLLLAVVIFAEKLLPRGDWTARAVGAALLALGLAVLAWPGLAALLRGQSMAM
jgi:predicted metal-binding membrane protein